MSIQSSRNSSTSSRGNSVLFLDTLNGLLEIDRLCVWPDQCSLLGVELHVLQQVPEDIAYRYALLALGQVHPIEESSRKGLFAKILSCGCSLRCLPMSCPQSGLI